MIRRPALLALAFGLAFPTHAAPVDMTLPNLTFPDPVTSPSTKGCDPAQTTAPCPAEG